MFDIGIGEILILAVLGLLIFGPERLPRAASDAAKMMRNVRAMATNARKDLADSAGMDLSEAKDALRSLQDLHPRRMVSGLFDDDDADGGSTQKGAKPPAGGASTTARFDPDAT